MKQCIVFYALLLVFFLPGCAPVKIYSDAALTKGTGLKCYNAKPYLQVEKDLQSGSILKASVIYLPDLSAPQYIKICGGPGSGKLDVKLSNGMIEAFGSSYDTKIPDTVEALAEAVSKSAEAITGLSGLKGVPQAGSSTITELFEVIMNEEGTILRKVKFEK